MRELALDPPYGPDGVWSRLDQLSVPAAFVWGDKDRFVGTKNIAPVTEVVPAAFQVRVPCAGHFDNGPHFVCMEMAALEAIRQVDDGPRTGWSPSRPGGTTIWECGVDEEPDEKRPAVTSQESASA